MLLPLGNPIKCHKEVLFLQSMIPLKCFDIFPLDWGMLRRSRWVQIFFLKDYSTLKKTENTALRRNNQGHTFEQHNGKRKIEDSEPHQK